VVAAQQEEVLGVLDLVGQQQADRLKALLASVNIVAEKQIVCLGRKTSVFEESEEIGVLAVDISANFEGSL